MPEILLNAERPCAAHTTHRAGLREPRADTPPGNACEGADLMEVLAATLHNRRPLQLQLEVDYRTVPLAVWPQAGVAHSPIGLAGLLALRLPDIRVLAVTPAPSEPPAGDGPAWPLGMLLWELALRGARGRLLPPISGAVGYRVPAGADLRALGLSGTLAAAVERLRQADTPLRDIAAWPGFDRDRAARLLNGLHLQTALLVSSSHPATLGGR
jgi:hypothetical protein